MFVVQLFPLYRFTLVRRTAPRPRLGDGAALAALLVSAWANFALTVKRLHDFGKPAAWALFTLVVGFIVFIVLPCVKGDPGPNHYGERTNAPALSMMRGAPARATCTTGRSIPR